SGDSEGLPIVLCEAQAIGLPVAAFEGPGINEAVVDGETALLAPSGDEPALAERIAAILADPDLATRLGQAGRQRAVACFSLTRQTELLEQAYDEALQ
ncbi:MAG TPA: glycosyltransferase, partial [Acidobacteriaceae bacterium]|nr:glycosyltransferase [Acidobacteriaceae bacterium]